MSGVYLLVVVAIWAGLSWALWKRWRRWRAAEGSNRRARDAVALSVLAAWFGTSFWYAGGQKVYYDTQVNRLCKQDGGVIVYEYVRLPSENFEKWGTPTFFKGGYDLGIAYSLDEEKHYYVSGNPEFLRYRYRIVRRSDGKVLGETTSYQRGGGDLPGPWQPSTFTCPSAGEAGPNALVKKVFVPFDGGTVK